MIHQPGCRDVARMKESNKLYVHDTLQNLIAKGYRPCQHCN
ncbi:MAG: hypothetical protein KHZ79_04680 [Atopobium minutum]|nr:hypothetical protein HMPREF1247_0547 [Atopobium sp. BV3Ac4]MBS4873651.1 hypothetical protein [Atopobium minutum]